MMRNVTGVVKESLDCADVYVFFLFHFFLFLAVFTDDNPFVDG